MLTQIKSALTANRDTLLQDTIGAAALVVILLGSLHLPGLI